MPPPVPPPPLPSNLTGLMSTSTKQHVDRYLSIDTHDHSEDSAADSSSSLSFENQDIHDQEVNTDIDSPDHMSIPFVSKSDNISSSEINEIRNKNLGSCLLTTGEDRMLGENSGILLSVNF